MKVLGQLGLLAVTLGLVVACSNQSQNSVAGRTAYSAMRSCVTRTQLDDFSLPNGDASPRAGVADGLYSYWVVGVAKVPGSPDQAIVRQTNEGLKWANLDVGPATGLAGQGASNNAILISSNHAIYVAQSYTENNLQLAAVLSSSDGKHWLTTPFHLHVGNNEKISAVVESPQHDIYFVGSSVDAKGASSGFILVLKDSKFDVVTEWVGGEINHLAVSATGTFFVAGSRGTHWALEKSVDSGKSWTSLDDFYENDTSVARSVLLYNGGAIIDVAGEAVDKNGPRWFVRQSVDSGKTWKIVNHYPAPQYKNAKVASLIDLNGTTVVLGTAQDFNSHYHWSVVMSDGVGGSHYKTVSSFRASEGNEAKASSLAATPTGELLLTGESQVDGHGHWITMKLSNCH